MHGRLRVWGPVLATLVGTWTTTAHATDKVVCVSAASEGQKLLRANKLLAARDQLLVCAAKDCPDVVSKDCTEWLGQAQRGIASVTVRARNEQGEAVEDAHVVVDGATSMVRSANAPMEVDPGPHLLRIEHVGHDAVEQRVEVGEGKRNVEVVVVLHRSAGAGPIGPSRPPESPAGGGGHIPTATWVLGGVGVLGLGSFAFFGLTGKSQQSDLKGTCAPYCTDSDVSPVHTKFLIANVSLIAGIVALGAATVVALVGTSSGRAAAATAASR